LSAIRTTIAWIVLAFALGSCRIRSGTEPYWQETRGHQHFKALTATPQGALALNDERNDLYRYPGVFGEPWIEVEKLDAVLIGGSPVATYVVLGREGRGALRRREGWAVKDYPGSERWGVDGVTASDTDALYVIADGRVRAVRDDRLGEEVCPGKTARALASSGPDVVWVVDEGGSLFRAGPGSCAPFDAPPALRAVSAFGPALTVADEQGTAFRRVESAWQPLPAPVRYRPDEFPQSTKVVALAQSALWLWAMDEDGFIHFLSDPT
jgi:hypothetical protein